MKILAFLFMILWLEISTNCADEELILNYWLKPIYNINTPPAEAGGNSRVSSNVNGQ